MDTISSRLSELSMQPNAVPAPLLRSAGHPRVRPSRHFARQVSRWITAFTESRPQMDSSANAENNRAAIYSIPHPLQPIGQERK